ncbi:MAG TPA: UPF0280 family protein [Candidatus Bathyarchaeia archaeon]|nr:UPF0280 family protein [Candidatus Bathyarchaeia archaeon]
MKGLFRRVFELKDSRGIIIADKKSAIDVAAESFRRNREELENFTESHHLFLESLKPVKVPAEPLVAKLMAEAASKADVGPMAAVAGVLADLAVADMVAEGCEVAVVEDGGEISAVSQEPVDVAMGVGDTPLSNRFGFRLTEFPVGVATSSGVFSHALSFGDAEAATVFCGNAGLADAAATAVGNVVKGDDVQAAIHRGIEKAFSIQGVEGVLIIYKGFVGTAGKIPQIIKIDPCEHECSNSL